MNTPEIKKLTERTAYVATEFTVRNIYEILRSSINDVPEATVSTGIVPGTF